MYVDLDGHMPISQGGNGNNGPDKNYLEKVKKAYTNFIKLSPPKPKAEVVTKPVDLSKYLLTKPISPKTPPKSEPIPASIAKYLLTTPVTPKTQSQTTPTNVDKNKATDKINSTADKIIDIVNPGGKERYENRNDSSFDKINYYLNGIPEDFRNVTNSKPFSKENLLASVVLFLNVVPELKGEGTLLKNGEKWVIKDAVEPIGLFRKTANTGEFKVLSEPMQLRNVKRVAKDAGVGLDGIKVRIARDSDLMGKGLYGYTHPGGKLIDLYPDAFKDTETLVKTLGHERIYVYQMKTLGPVNDSATGGLFERGAEASEESWWKYFNHNIGGN